MARALASRAMSASQRYPARGVVPLVVNERAGRATAS
jgi:hypothetical protein